MSSGSGKTSPPSDGFRQKFWKLVAEDPVLKESFYRDDLKRMKNGRAPTVSKSQFNGNRVSYELHHITPINKGGDVYSMDNLVIVTPRYHKEILSKKYHTGK